MKNRFYTILLWNCLSVFAGVQIFCIPLKSAKGYPAIIGFKGVYSHHFAKFGRLYMHNGKWQDRQTTPNNWVETPLTQFYPESKDGQGYCYNYQWRMICEHKEYSPKGIWGQILYVNKDLDIIIDRLSEQMRLSYLFQKTLFIHTPL